MFQAAPGQLRDPYNSAPVPACAVAANHTSAEDLQPDPTSVSSVAFNASVYGYSGRACYVVTPDGEQQVVEMRVWVPGRYNYERYYARLGENVQYWAIYGIGATLLGNMRFVHAGFAVALPGAIFWGAYISTGLFPLTMSLLGFAPAMAAILGVSRKMERRDRSFFLERRKVQRMLDAKNKEIRVQSIEIQNKEGQVRAVKRRLHDAQKVITEVMADAHAALHPYEHVRRAQRPPPACAQEDTN